MYPFACVQRRSSLCLEELTSSACLLAVIGSSSLSKAPPCRLASRLAILDMDQKPAVRVLYGGMRKFKQVIHRSGRRL